MRKIANEITIACYSALAAVNAIQVAEVDVPKWIHVAILAVSAAAAAFINRSQVTPISKLNKP